MPDGVEKIRVTVIGGGGGGGCHSSHYYGGQGGGGGAFASGEYNVEAGDTMRIVAGHGGYAIGVLVVKLVLAVQPLFKMLMVPQLAAR